MRVLVLAPHADDETLGMGATIAKRVDDGDEVIVAVATGHGTDEHPLWSVDEFEMVRAEAREAMAHLGVRDLRFRELPAAMLDATPRFQVNSTIKELIDECRADDVYLPYMHDLHHDHAAITYAGLVATRPYLTQDGRKPSRVFMYETPSETHLVPGGTAPGFVPNCWVDVRGTIDRKIAAWNCYRSQRHETRTPRSAEALVALATWRGAHIGSPAAEAFLLIQWVQ